MFAGIVLIAAFVFCCFPSDSVLAGEKQPFTDYCQRLEQEVQGRKHGFEAFGEETQSKGILIETTVSNTGAQKLYECNGYQKVTERFFYERKNKPKKNKTD